MKATNSLVSGESTVQDLALNVDRGRIPMWVIYDHPTDYPTEFVARLHFSTPRPEASGWMVRSPDVETMQREFARLGFLRLARHINDDPVIMETWLL
jgi:hypothetical protein